VGELAGIAKETFDYFVAHHGSESAVEKLASNMLISWEIKKIISEQKENSLVDNLINQGLNSGAIGAKLCGAGGSGFVLFLVPPEQRNAFVRKFEHLGAQEIASVPYGSKVRIIE
jgi:D-glycero-alpha-D-manno-heptose-7-phosphate kinase